MIMLPLLVCPVLASPWSIVVDAPVSPMRPDEVDTILEWAAAQAPPDSSIQVLVPDARGRLRPIGDLRPPLSPPPEKDPPSRNITPVRSNPMDLPGASVGGLTDREVYLSQSHGWIWYDSLWDFSTQRGNAWEIVEDFHNAEASDQYLTQYLENAGAAVFTARERDMNTDMAIADNDGDGYFESGSGFEDSYAGFADQGLWAYGEDPFDLGTTRRFPADSGSVASWMPEVPADGYYAVYVAWDNDSENAPDAHYQILHPGGVIDRYYSQSMHGSTWQYMDTLWLPQGVGSLEVQLIGDSSCSTCYLSADAVRIGGGMGDVGRHGTLSDRPRWEEGALEYTQWNGAPTSVYDPYVDGNGTDVSCRSRWADWEHPSTEDAVYLSWHTNGWDGSARGTSTYYYEGSGGTPIEGSGDFAEIIQDELMSTYRLLYESNWSDRGVNRADFGEVNPSNNDDMPAALVELLFHDNETDAAYLKDPDFRRISARALYRSIVRYFAARDGMAEHYLPEPPEEVSIIHGGDGRLVVSWIAGPVGFPDGDAPTGYVVLSSTDGRSWDNGTAVTGTSATLDTAGGDTVYVKVAATNEGGVSFPSEVVAARRSPDGEAPVLVVNGFDRLEDFILIREDLSAYDLGTVARMFLNRMNTFDYVVQHGAAISAAGWPFDSASDEAFESMDLSAYSLVVWASGNESTADTTFSESQQARVRDFTDQGGALFVSGSEILWDLDYRGSSTDQAFAEEVLGVLMAADDSETTDASGTDVLAGLDLAFGEIDGAPYPVEYPDVADTSMTPIATYAGGELAGALDESRHVAWFGFPFECIASESSRAEVMARLLPLLVPDYTPPTGDETGDTGGPPDTDETDPPETGDPDSNPPDETSTPDSGRHLDTSPEPPPGKLVDMNGSRCGCATGVDPAGWAALLGLLAFRRRRR